jgi:hypothetical protein
MPNAFGGDQCGKDYAPHMWIGKEFVGGTGQYRTIGKEHYHFGMTKEGKLVVEREVKRKRAKCYDLEKWVLVSEKKIPKEVKELVQTFSEREAEEEELQELFDKDSLT